MEGKDGGSDSRGSCWSGAAQTSATWEAAGKTRGQKGQEIGNEGRRRWCPCYWEIGQDAEPARTKAGLWTCASASFIEYFLGMGITFWVGIFYMYDRISIKHLPFIPNKNLLCSPSLPGNSPPSTWPKLLSMIFGSSSSNVQSSSSAVPR